MAYGLVVRAGEYEYRVDILAAIESMLDGMIARHSKVLVVRIDIRYPSSYQIPPSQNLVTELFRRLRAYYKYHGVDAQYLVVREQCTSLHPHHHAFVLLDGHKRENGWGVRQKAADIWRSLVGEGGAPCIHLCEPFQSLSGIMIRRPTEEYGSDPSSNQTIKFEADKRAVLNWLAYLAKTHTKGNAPPNAKEFHSSRFAQSGL